MHEFSIAQHIVDIAIRSATENHVDHVVSVEVEIGEAAGVVTDALEFAWKSARKDTMLQQASLVIKTIPVEVVCKNCKTQYNPEEIYDICPKCGDVNPEIIKGKELRVSSITT